NLQAKERGVRDLLPWQSRSLVFHLQTETRRAIEPFDSEGIATGFEIDGSGFLHHAVDTVVIHDCASRATFESGANGCDGAVSFDGDALASLQGRALQIHFQFLDAGIILEHQPAL